LAEASDVGGLWRVLPSERAVAKGEDRLVPQHGHSVLLQRFAVDLGLVNVIAKTNQLGLLVLVDLHFAMLPGDEGQGDPDVARLIASH